MLSRGTRIGIEVDMFANVAGEGAVMRIRPLRMMDNLEAMHFSLY